MDNIRATIPETKTGNTMGKNHKKTFKAIKRVIP
jgi:hypothetical protein